MLKYIGYIIMSVICITAILGAIQMKNIAQQNAIEIFVDTHKIKNPIS